MYVISAVIRDQQFKVTVVGSGYVDMSLAVLLAQYDAVTLLDIDGTRVAKINDVKTTLPDPEISGFLSTKNLKLSATGETYRAYR